MINESEMELFERWLATTDKEECVKLGLQLFPETTRKELEDNFDKAMAGYDGREPTPEEREMLNDAKISSRKHFLKLCDEMANERQRK